MLRGGCPGIFSVLILSAPLAAQTPEPLEAKVQALAHPRYAEREKAARDLVAAGEPALKALRAVAASPDPELRARAAIVAEKIDRAVRSEKLLVAPKLAIKLDKVPLQQALTQVAQKSGLRFQLDPGKDTNTQRPITLDTGDVPFWEAIHAFYSEAGLVENDMPATPTTPSEGRSSRIYYEKLSGRRSMEMIRLTDVKSVTATTSATPAFTGKAIRVRALPAAFPQNKFDSASGDITLHLDLDAAPALSFEEFIGVEIRRATTDERHVLAPSYPATPFNPGYYGLEQMLVARQVVVINGELLVDDGMGGTGYYPVTLKAGTIRPRKLAQLEGVVVARVLAPTEPLITVSDVFSKKKDHVFETDGRSLQIVDVQPGSDKSTASLRVRLTATADSVNEVLNFPVQIKGRVRQFVRINRKTGEAQQNMPEFQLRDADGKLIKSTPQATGTAFDGITASVEVTLKVERPVEGLANVSLTLTGRRSVVVEMPFTLSDVTLP